MQCSVFEWNWQYTNKAGLCLLLNEGESRKSWVLQIIVRLLFQTPVQQFKDWLDKLILEQIPILARTNPGDHQPPFMAKALWNHHGWENCDISDLDVYISFTVWNIFVKVLLCSGRIKWPKSWQHSTHHVRLINRLTYHNGDEGENVT